MAFSSVIATCPRDAERRLKEDDVKLRWIHIKSLAHSVSLPVDLCFSLQTSRSNVTRLTLSNVDLRAVDVFALTQFIKNNNMVATLNLEKANLRDDGVIMIADALQCNTSLYHINLYNNDVADYHRVDTAFVHTVRVNRAINRHSVWYIRSRRCNGYRLYLKRAKRLGCPSMLAQLDLCEKHHL